MLKKVMNASKVYTKGKKGNYRERITNGFIVASVNKFKKSKKTGEC
jgi:hypothetical protein